MKKKMNLILKKCKTLSRQLGRTSSYSSLRSKSARHDHHHHLDTWGSAAAAAHLMMLQQDHGVDGGEKFETILVGSSRRRLLIKSKYLDHPLLKALIQKSAGDEDCCLSIKCEVVLFDHLLWMLENADPNLPNSSDDNFNLSMEELADLYLF